MYIKFKTLKFKNFMSYGNSYEEFNFENGIDIISGKNGQGKSVLADAMTYSLFGKSFRKLRKINSLINITNNKQLETELVFEVDDKEFMVKRGMKPAIFEIYSKSETNVWHLIDQEATTREYQIMFEENILGFTETVFRQLVILGANVANSKNFMDLNSTEKEEVFQIVTDTSLFKQLSDIIKMKRNEYKTIMTENNYKFDILSNSLSAEKQSIIQAQIQNESLKNNKKNRVESINNFLDESLEKVERYDDAIRKLKELKNEHDSNNLDISDMMVEISAFKDVINEAEGKKIGYEHLKDASIVCEECNHENIPGEYSDDDYKHQLQLLEKTTKEYDDLSENLSVLKQKNDKIKETLLNAKRISANKKSLELEIKNKKEELKEVEAWKLVDIDTSNIERTESELNETKQILSRTETKLKQLVKLLSIIGGDNLKGYILSKQIPLLNKYINTFIEKFSDFEFNFVLDTNFNEKFISRSEQQEFNSFSNGQKQRFTFAILFAFLKLIEERNGISTNVLFLDEVLDSSADSNGRSELLEILFNEFSKEKNILIITHNDEIRERADIIHRNFNVINTGFSKIIST